MVMISALSHLGLLKETWKWKTRTRLPRKSILLSQDSWLNTEWEAESSVFHVHLLSLQRYIKLLRLFCCDEATGPQLQRDPTWSPDVFPNM